MSSAARPDLFLLTVSGMDRPGVTAALTDVLGQHGVIIRDIGQSVIHEQLNLGMLVEVPGTADGAPVLKEVLFCAHELDVQVRFSPVEPDAYERWAAEQGIQRYKITLLARRLEATHLAAVSRVVADAGLNVRAIERVSGRFSFTRPDALNRACVELSVRGVLADSAATGRELLSLADTHDFDIAIQVDDIHRRNRRLVAFDMDSTLIQAEVIDELAKRGGVGEQVSKITEQAMQGEIDFAESFKRRVALLEGVPEAVLREVAEGLPLTEGVERLCSILKGLGYKLVLISGGFTYFANYLQQKLGFDYVFANELEISDGVLTGRHRGEIVDAKRKAAALAEVAELEGISLSQTIAVGDGANDLPMLAKAGLGVAFHAKPLVRGRADHSLSTMGIDALLYLMGMRDWEVKDHDA